MKTEQREHKISYVPNHSGLEREKERRKIKGGETLKGNLKREAQPPWKKDQRSEILKTGDKTQTFHDERDDAEAGEPVPVLVPSF